MKDDHVKTTETTEEVSSHPGEKGHWSQKRHRNTPCAVEKQRVNWKKDLQICGPGKKSRKRPTLVVGKKPNGKYQFISAGKERLIACLHLFCSQAFSRPVAEPTANCADA
jgi:hypothetical protein